MKTIRSDEEAVSPVIGVILMVAIVVILAAVIAAFVFGMAGSTSTTKTVGVVVTMNASGGLGDILFEGGVDLNKMTQGFNVTVGGTPDLTYDTAPDVGQMFTTQNPIPGARVIIVGNFQDGSSQVIYDRQF